jgi:hypothetical protein
MNERRVEAYRDQQWIEVSFGGLYPKEVFRMFDMPENKPVLWNNEEGLDEFFSLAPPYQNEEGQWEVDCKVYNPEMDEPFDIM